MVGVVGNFATEFALGKPLWATAPVVTALVGLSAVVMPTGRQVVDRALLVLGRLGAHLLRCPGNPSGLAVQRRVVVNFSGIPEGVMPRDPSSDLRAMTT